MQVPVTILNLDRFTSCVSIWTSVCDATHTSAWHAMAWVMHRGSFTGKFLDRMRLTCVFAPREGGFQTR